MTVGPPYKSRAPSRLSFPPRVQLSPVDNMETFGSPSYSDDFQANRLDFMAVIRRRYWEWWAPNDTDVADFDGPRTKALADLWVESNRQGVTKEGFREMVREYGRFAVRGCFCLFGRVVQGRAAIWVFASAGPFGVITIIESGN